MEEYSKDSQASKNKKFIKKILKKDLTKELARSSRQMIAIDMPRVNSISPNDVLALVPSSYLVKKPKC